MQERFLPQEEWTKSIPSRESRKIKELRERYFEAISFAIDQFKSLNIPYAIAGGIGAELWAGKEINPVYMEKTRDIDIVPLIDADAPEWNTVRMIQAKTAEYYNIHLDVDFFWKGVKKKGSKFLLYYKDIEVPIKDGEEIFASITLPKELNPFLQEVATFSPQTIFHLYGLVSKHLRNKDKPRVFALARYIKNTAQSKHDIYHAFHPQEGHTVFHEFTQMRHKRYKLTSFFDAYKALESNSRIGRKIKETRHTHKAVDDFLQKAADTCVWAEALLHTQA